MMQIKDSGERTQFETGAVRDMHTGKGRMDLLPWEALVEVSKHCEEGALKYGERNCEKGIPIHSLIDSAFRHLAKYMMGMKDEPHLRAAAWNILFALYMEIKHPELQDIPTRLVEPVKFPPPCPGCVYQYNGKQPPCNVCGHKNPEGTQDYFKPVEKPVPKIKSEKEPCCRCKHRDRFGDEFPCDGCVHKQNGTEDMFVPYDCVEDEEE